MKRSISIQSQFLALQVHHFSMCNMLYYSLFRTLGKAGCAVCARMQMALFISGCGAAASGAACLLPTGFAWPFKRSLASKRLRLPRQTAETQTPSSPGSASILPGDGMLWNRSSTSRGEEEKAGQRVGPMQDEGPPRA